jgi:predicted lactoylglutathione lyase
VTEASGGDVPKEPDHGLMYQRSFENLDGYQWKPVCMAPEAMEP